LGELLGAAGAIENSIGAKRSALKRLLKENEEVVFRKLVERRDDLLRYLRGYS
jgi:hypothetical protein